MAGLAEVPLKQAISGAEANEWYRAVGEEVRSLVKNNTWDLVDRPSGGIVIGGRFVLRNKFKPDGTLERRKARMVARGFAQRPGIHFNETFAPVARLSSVRLCVAVAARHGMRIRQFDVATAYLNGFLEEEILMEPPELLAEGLEVLIRSEDGNSDLRKKAESMLVELRTGNKVCRLRKALYGLRQAGRSWYIKLDKVLRRFGAKPSNADPCVYLMGHGEDVSLIVVYVDDVLMMSRNVGKISEFGNYLSKEFDVRDLGDASHCLGIEFSRKQGRIGMHQTGYIREVLARFGMTDSRPVLTPMDVNVKLKKAEGEASAEDGNLPYRELVGALMYLAVATRPDIAFAVSALSQFCNSYSRIHWTAAKRVLRYLKGTMDLGLVFRPDADPLRGYVDADWASCLDDRRSYTGFSFLLSNGPVSWDAKKQRTVALSTTESEYMALTEATKEAIFLRGFLSEMGLMDLAEVTIYGDNMGAKKLAENPVFHARSKHIDVRHHFVRSALKEKLIDIRHVSTEDMGADVLTKGLPGPKHRRCLELLGLGVPP